MFLGYTQYVPGVESKLPFFQKKTFRSLTENAPEKWCMEDEDSSPCGMVYFQGRLLLNFQGVIGDGHQPYFVGVYIPKDSY